MPDEQSSLPERRGSARPTGRGRRADDPILDLTTHEAETVSAPQIARYCDVSLQTVYKWIDSRKLSRAPHFTREIRVKTDHFRLFVLLMRRSA